MSILLLLTAMLLFVSPDVAHEGIHADYLAPRRTRVWKGLFVLLILLSHYTGYISTTEADEFYLAFRQGIGQAVAAYFFFTSGYGLTLRARSGGFSYLKTLPKRFLRVWLTCAVSVALMWGVQTLRGRSYDWDIILMAFGCWVNIGNSTWYIFVILIEYLFLALAMLPLCLRRNQLTELLIPLILTVCTVLFIGWMQRMELEEYWYDTVILLPIGAWWALLAPRCEKMFRSPLGWSCLLLTAVTGGILLYQNRMFSFAAHEGFIIVFCLLTAVLSMKVTPGSALLGFLGDHVLPVYLFQRLPMIAVYECGLADTQPILSFAIVLAACGVISVLYDQVTRLLRRR